MAKPISKIEELYDKFTNGFIAELQSNEFYTYFMNMVRSSENNVSVFEKYIARNIDMKWVEAIESAIIPIDTIIRNPGRYIKNEEDILPIERVRRVTPEAVRHLATHTNLIQRVEGDDVTPNKLLNITKEESFDTYENRFIYTLLIQLNYFLDKRMRSLMENRKVDDEFEYRLNGTCIAGDDRMSYDFAMKYKTPHIDVGENTAELLFADVSKMNDLQRVERIRMILYGFQGSAFIKGMSGCALVRPPLTMTNVLTKNQNFRKAVDLWRFISTYDDVGYTIDMVEREKVPSERFLNELFSIVTLQYVLMKKNTAHSGDIGVYDERRKEVKPEVIKRSIDEIAENYSINIDEVRRIYIEQTDREKRRKVAQQSKIRAILSRAISSEKALIAEEERIIKEQAAKEKARQKVLLQKEREKIAAKAAKEKAKRKAADKKEKEKEKLALQKAKEKEKLRKIAVHEKEKAKQKAAVRKQREKERELKRVKHQKELVAKRAQIAKEKARARATAAKQRQKNLIANAGKKSVKRSDDNND